MPEKNNRKRILIIDDDVDHLLVVKLIFERRGYEVLTLNDCEDFIERIKIYRPGLIFMDHNMPDITGLEAIKLIKADRDCKDVPVIYFTAREDVEQLAAEAGADGWISKPFKLEDVVKTVEDLFKPKDDRFSPN